MSFLSFLFGDTESEKENWENAINKFKYGDKVKISEHFYNGMVGTIVGKEFSDGYDCTVFDGFKVKLDDGRTVIIEDEYLEGE